MHLLSSCLPPNNMYLFKNKHCMASFKTLLWFWKPSNGPLSDWRNVHNIKHMKNLYIHNIINSLSYNYPILYKSTNRWCSEHISRNPNFFSPLLILKIERQIIDFFFFSFFPKRFYQGFVLYISWKLHF